MRIRFSRRACRADEHRRGRAAIGKRVRERGSRGNERVAQWAETIGCLALLVGAAEVALTTGTAPVFVLALCGAAALGGYVLRYATDRRLAPDRARRP
ncbi:hypothetical protein DFR74_10721 [Nocardia puris]|uniref:Uncharacterized protein n=1 Tax=Nocardia puris TaxID=208602 RepID=A0A366DJ51_9NOCA|nr:hypothetical protein DFR74_10721 [Nocardia puris]